MSKLVPAFLKKLDKYLLLHQPEIWISRIHYVAFYLGLAFLAVFGFTFLLDVQKNSIPTYELAWAFLSLPLVVGLVIWVRKIVQYNPVREFAKTTLLAEYKTILALFLSVLMFFAIPFASTIAGKLKVNTVISDAEYRADSLAYEKVSFLFNQITDITEEENEYIIVERKNSSYSYNPSSVDKLPKDKPLILSYLKEYRRVYNEYHTEKTRFYNNRSKKYELITDEVVFEELFVFHNTLYVDSFVAKLYKVDKVKRLDLFPFKLILVIFGVASLLTLLVYSFKNSRKKDFLFAIIGLALLPEVMGFIGFIYALVADAFSETTFFVFTVLPFSVLFFLVLQGLSSPRYKKRYGVSLIMLHLLLLILPLVIMGWYDERSGVMVSDEAYQLTVFLSALGMLVLTPLLFRPLYKKLYALPEY